jgi:hypothetical protein
MINSVRNTVMFLLNKDNRGYVSPSEFDYFAKQAQLEIFESYFSEYSKALLAQNSRKRGLNYGDSVAHIQNKIDIFSKNQALTFSTDHFVVPSDLYKLINLTYGGKVVQQVPMHRLDMIVNSNLSAPSVTYPVFTREGVKMNVWPTSISTTGDVIANYIRKPLDPHWGYNTINSDPVYNSDSTVDFEISEEDETDLIIKICKYSGLSIRESDIVQVTSQQEQLEYQKENS